MGCSCRMRTPVVYLWDGSSRIVEMILSGHAEASARATRLADRECKIIISGGRERCTDLRRPQKLLELDDCRSSRRTGRERFPQDVLRFAQRVFEDDCGIHRFSVRFPARMNCPPLQRSFLESEACLEPSTDSQASVSCFGFAIGTGAQRKRAPHSRNRR
jgi:hypothetical protein